MYTPPPLLFPILLVWSAIWAGLATFFLSRALEKRGVPEFWRGFWLMNGLWAAVNVLIVAWGIYDPAESQEELRGLLRLNSFLDVGYLLIAFGLLFIPKPVVRGLSAGILVQGLFLLCYDLGWKAALSASQPRL